MEVTQQRGREVRKYCGCHSVVKHDKYELGYNVDTLLQLRLMALSFPTCWSLL